MTLEFNTPYLNDYLAMVEDTESPRIFHIWAAIWAISSSLGLRCKLPFGTFDIYPNHYNLFVGTPGTRKSTAMGIAERLVRDATGVRFAPSDTGFQRQGLALALLGGVDSTQEFVKQIEHAMDGDQLSSLSDLASINVAPEKEDTFVDSADKHHLAICADEFSRVIGQNNAAMLDFLGERYDAKGYEYQTRQTHIKMPRTLINLVACTTPTSIAYALPPQSGGQGFLSRIILVYGTKKYKKVPRPKAPPFEVVARVKESIQRAYYQLSGAFEETPEAFALSEKLYDYTPDISDSRFTYYMERRFTHLLKLGMVLAASRGTLTISAEDYQEAHRILQATEVGMPDALGEFGMNPLAALKQDVLEQLRAQQGPLLLEQIVAMFHRDARGMEIMEVVNDLIKSKQIVMTTTTNNKRVVTAQFKFGSTEDSMMSLLAEKD